LWKKKLGSVHRLLIESRRSEYEFAVICKKEMGLHHQKEGCHFTVSYEQQTESTCI